MAERSITSADALYVLSSADFALAGTVLEGYAADAAFTLDAADTAETQLGVDGKLSAGWVPRSYNQTITLQADSPSCAIFEGLVAAQDVSRNVFRLNAVITLKGNQRAYNLTRGVLKSHTAMPGAQRVLQPQTYTIEWERVLPVPIP